MLILPIGAISARLSICFKKIIYQVDKKRFGDYLKSFYAILEHKAKKN